MLSIYLRSKSCSSSSDIRTFLYLLLLKDHSLFEIEMLLACEYEDPQFEEFLSCVNTVSLIGLYYSMLEFPFAQYLSS